MSLVQIDWKPNAKKLREFGIAMIVGFAVIGSLLYYGVFPFGSAYPTAAFVCWAFGVISGGLGLTGSKAALPIYWLWMGIAFVMGSIISRIILVAVFFLVFTPMGLLGRLLGRDKLILRKPQKESYWVPVNHPSDKKRYLRQF